MHHPFSYEPPIPSPISIFPFNTNHLIYSLRATAEASTPSTSSIATPVQDRFVVQPTPITTDESCQSFSSYSGQACMPSDPVDFAPSSCPNGEGVNCALLNPHRVMCQCSQHPSLAYSATAHPSSAFVSHPDSFTLAQASHFYPPPPPLLQHHHRHSETTMNVFYDSTTKSTQTNTTTMTVLQTGLASSVNARATLAPDHSYAPTFYTHHNPPLVRPRLTSNGWQPPDTSSCFPFPPYVAPAPVAPVPLHHPKPVHPLPEWTKKSFLVLDELFCEESLNTDSSTHAVPPQPEDASSLEYWNYGAPIASATIEPMIDPQDGSRIGDDYDYDEDEDDDNGENDDDEYDDDEDTDMEGDFEMEGIDLGMSGFHATPPAPFYGTLLSAAVPLSSSSLLCQPLPDFVQNQFRASAV